MQVHCMVILRSQILLLFNIYIECRVNTDYRMYWIGKWVGTIGKTVWYKVLGVEFQVDSLNKDGENALVKCRTILQLAYQYGRSLITMDIKYNYNVMNTVVS